MSNPVAPYLLANTLVFSPALQGPPGSPPITTLTGAFTMPAVSASATAVVGTTAWMVVGGYVQMAGAGVLQIVSIPSLGAVVLANTGTNGNAAQGTVIEAGAQVGVSGAPSQAATWLSPNYVNGPATVSAAAGNLYVINLQGGAVVLNIPTLSLSNGTGATLIGFQLVGGNPSSSNSLTVNAPEGVEFAPPPPNNTTTISPLVYDAAEDAGTALTIANLGVESVYSAY